MTIKISARHVFHAKVWLALLGMSAAMFATHARAADDVRIGISPYFDYQPWVVAHELGIDAEQGINLKVINVSTAANGIAALRHGDIDVSSSCHVCDFPFYKTVPSLRNWIITDQFKGFIVVGRKSKTRTFAELVDKLGPKGAKAQILESFRGKTFVIKPTSYEPLLKAALSQAGLTLEDVKVLAFPDDAKAALAFETGEGDYYMGSLPQETKLLSREDKYVNVGGSEILGPAGLWYSTMVSTEDWLTANHDIAMKLTAVWYRTVRYLNERNEEFVPLWTKSINERAASAFEQEEVKFVTSRMLAFPPFETARETIYNPASDLYWKRSVEYYVGPNEDKLPEDFSVEKFDLEEQYFRDFLTRDELTQWVNSPLK